MAVNISGLRRNLKNVAHNYTDAQVKVREATSNDPWGPSSTMMSEIADLTYNVVAFSEIMQMVWKRLNDHGKNWRHVYKALVLLEYLIKTGSEKVAQQCKENIFAIQTLKDFQYLDDNKDQGINVREKAKALVALLKDDERLKNERVRALKAKERFAQSTAGIGSDTVYNHNRERNDAALRQAGSDYEVSVAAAAANGSELEAARPQTIGEEELQLQLALAMSREEAEQEETKTKSDDMRLQMALQKSKDNGPAVKPSSDLLDLDFGNPTASAALTPPAPSPPPPHMPAPPTRTAASALSDPWGMPQQSTQPEPAAAQNDPWGGSPAAPAAAAPANPDPWSPVGAGAVASSASPVNLGASRTSPMPAGFALQQPQPTQPPAVANDPWNPVSGTSPVPPPSSQMGTTSAEMRVSPAVGGPAGPAAAAGESLDLFSPQVQNQLAEFDTLRGQIEGGAPPSNGNNGNGGMTSPNPFDMGDLSGRLGDGALVPSGSSPGPNGTSTGAKPKTSTVQTILGEHSNLVNLDNLVSESAKTARNPFEQQAPNPFQAKAQKPPMKDLLSQNNPGAAGWSAAATQQQQQQQQQQEMNPFF